MASPAYRIRVEGLDGLRAAMRKAPAVGLAEAAKALEKSALLLERNAKVEAPVNKGGGGGSLRQSIRSGMTGRLSAFVGAFAAYAGFVETGTRPHVIRPRNKKALSFPWSRGGFQAAQRGGVGFVKAGLTAAGRVKFHANVTLQEVHHPGTRPNAFMARAVARSKAKIGEFFKLALERAMRAAKQ